MVERCKQGLCFNCDEQYIHGHHRRCLFYIKVDYYDEDGSVDDSFDPLEHTSTVSLHALIGLRSIRANETM